MDLWHTPDTFANACTAARASGRRVALVPTMGALHDGHMALVAEARRHADFLAVSIFVNPTQFGPSEDLDAYPRKLEADADRCREAGVHAVFAPEPGAMYPAGEETRVRVGKTAEALCGPHRPGHFEGVATIVAKLFALTGPCVAVFGRKDYQQLAVIRRMTADLMLPVSVVGVPTVRDADSLAMSSRNAYLSAEARRRALALPRALSAAVHAYEAGERRASEIRAIADAIVRPEVDRVDYVEVADPTTIQPLAAGQEIQGRALVAIAARVGSARLIDNVVLGEDRAPIASRAEL